MVPHIPQKSQTQVNQAPDGTTEIQGQSTEAWIKPKNLRRRLAVRGSLQECPDVAEPDKKALFDLLKRKYAQKMDFLLSGISNVEDTEFETPDGKPDADRYTVALKDQLTGMCMESCSLMYFNNRC